MFHRIIFLLLIVSSLSCNFNRCADCFQSFSEQRFPEYSKCSALSHFKIKNKHNKFFIILELKCVNVRSNTHHSQHCKSQNRLADLVHSGVVCKLFLSKITQPFPEKSHECALKLTELWNTSLLFDLSYKFINGSLAFSPG